MPTPRWVLLLAVTSLLLALLLQAPQAVRLLDARSQGLLTELNSDEGVYQARVEEALQGRPEQAAEAIVGDERIEGAQLAFLEVLEGTVFRFTDLRAPELFQVMDSVIPVLLFLALVAFFRRSGFTRWQSYGGALLFCLLELYNLNRPLYQRTSFLWSMVAILLILEGLRGRKLAGWLGGILIGLSVGGYFWGWTFSVAWLGVFILWECSEWLTAGRSSGVLRSTWYRSPWIQLCIVALIAAITAVPSVLHMRELAALPAYADAVFRSGIHPSHLPESWMYSALFLVMAAGAIVGMVRYPALRTYKLVGVTILTAFVILNQQLIHGITFNFASHYLFALVLAAIGLVLFGIALRFTPRGMLIPIAAAILYLAAVGYDGRYSLSLFFPKESQFATQHFKGALPELDALPRTRILSDPDTSLFLAGWTKHDVVYTLYLKNAVITHQELADRFCVTQLPLPPEERHLEERQPLIWPDANSAFRDPAIRTREAALVSERCAALDVNPAGALKAFDVGYIFWDEKRQPQWDLSRLKERITKEASGNGWSLWKIYALNPLTK